MALAIVWSNPLPPTRTESKVERLLAGQSGAPYIAFRVDSRTSSSYFSAVAA